MIQLWISIGIAAHSAVASQPFPVQFGREVAGRNVAVCIDGGRVHQTFAGKLAFRDPSSTWASVCADVRSPIRGGQRFVVRPMSSSRAGARVSLAGHIVARFLNRVQSPDECAGLQLAVWEAIEDGGQAPNFLQGRFQAQASRTVMAYAAAYYSEGVYEPTEAVYLQTNPGGAGGQSQLAMTPTQ